MGPPHPCVGHYAHDVVSDFSTDLNDFRCIVAPQAQLLETAKSVGPEALFKQVVKFEQIDPLWSILGENKGGPYCRKSEIT